jgi:hypothetical protein
LWLQDTAVPPQELDPLAECIELSEAIGLRQRRHFAEAAGIHNEPSIADPGRVPYRHLGLSGDIGAVVHPGELASR